MDKIKQQKICEIKEVYWKTTGKRQVFLSQIDASVVPETNVSEDKFRKIVKSYFTVDMSRLNKNHTHTYGKKLQ